MVNSFLWRNSHTSPVKNCCQRQTFQLTCYQATHTTHSLKISSGKWLSFHMISTRPHTWTSCIIYAVPGTGRFIHGLHVLFMLSQVQDASSMDFMYYLCCSRYRTLHPWTSCIIYAVPGTGRFIHGLHVLFMLSQVQDASSMNFYFRRFLLCCKFLQYPTCLQLFHTPIENVFATLILSLWLVL